MSSTKQITRAAQKVVRLAALLTKAQAGVANATGKTITPAASARLEAVLLKCETLAEEIAALLAPVDARMEVIEPRARKALGLAKRRRR